MVVADEHDAIVASVTIGTRANRHARQIMRRPYASARHLNRATALQLVITGQPGATANPPKGRDGTGARFWVWIVSIRTECTQ